MQVLRRAFWDTIAPFGPSLPKIFLMVGGYLVSSFLLFWWFENDKAIEELTANSIGVIALVIPFAFMFLFNLWLAPYRIMADRLDAIEKQTGRTTPRVESPQNCNVTDYKEFRNFLLYEAACLWVEVQPDHPVTHPMAKLKLGQLKSAIRGSELHCQWRNGLGEIFAALSGRTMDRNPSDKQQVLDVSLRRYADNIGDVPKFLQHVRLPIELPPDKDKEGEPTKPLTPGTTAA